MDDIVRYLLGLAFVWLGLFIFKCLLGWVRKNQDLQEGMKYGLKAHQRRSSKWPDVRDWCIERDGGCCQICGERRRKYLRGHHKTPFHVAPHLELDPSNVTTLCEGPVFNCHLFFGHLGNFATKYNPTIDEDILIWQPKMKPVAKL